MHFGGMDFLSFSFSEVMVGFLGRSGAVVGMFGIRGLLALSASVGRGSRTENTAVDDCGIVSFEVCRFLSD